MTTFTPPPPKPGTQAVSDRLGAATLLHLYTRHVDTPDAVFELAWRIATTAQEVDHATADLLRDIRSLAESLTGSADRLVEGRRFDTGILQLSGVSLDIAAGRHALLTDHLNRLIDAYISAVKRPTTPTTPGPVTPDDPREQW